MRRRRSLKTLYSAFDSRIERLSRIVDGSSIADPLADRNLAYVMIESLNGWGIFAREYYLSCTLYRARTIDGLASGPPTAIPTERDALIEAVRLLKPQALSKVLAGSAISGRDEPTWHESRTLLVLGSSLGFANFSSIAAAFSYSTTFFRDAPPSRNFFAHRNAASAEKVRRLASGPPYLSAEVRPHRFLKSLVPGRPQSVISDWLDDLRLVSHELCR
jgi:hypothetical protein